MTLKQNNLNLMTVLDYHNNPDNDQNVRNIFENLAEIALNPQLDDAYIVSHNPDTYEVEIESSVTLEDYERITPPAEMDQLKHDAEAMKGKKILFVNATASGGGVAIMRQTLIHLYKLLGVDAKWYALKADEPDKKFFDVTKQKFHNVLQGVAKPDVCLNEDDTEIYNSVIRDNVDVLEKPLSEADVIVIDDWQPSGLIPYIKGTEQNEGINPSAKILFRDHIHTEGKLMVEPGTPQNVTWNFIWNNNQVNCADTFITHPVDDFVPSNVPDNKVIFMPATADLLDDLNRPLTEHECKEGITFINEQLANNENQKPLDLDKPYIVLIARFDPSKGMPQGIESYAKARLQLVEMGYKENDIPQLVVLGNGSIDDPDGVPVLAEIMRTRREQYSDIKDDLKVARVPHNDLAINALLKGAKIALQPSTKEGFESRVSDAIFQGVPVIGSDRGGIPLQIVEGQSGFVASPYDTDKWANIIVDLMHNTEKYNTLRKTTFEQANNNNKIRFTTISNAQRWLTLSLELMHNTNFEGNRRWPEEL